MVKTITYLRVHVSTDVRCKNGCVQREGERMPTVTSRYTTASQRFDRPSSRDEASGRAPVVLMVSGGADSTALLLIAATSMLDIGDGRGEARIARERLHVLHVNHQLRGIDASEDEEFVRSISERFGIPCTVERVDVAELAQKRFGGNVENAGREVRYALANRLANDLSAKVGTPRSAARIVTAHTADDRAETFLMNAITGSGVSGLSSIPRRRNRVVRPLLDCTHQELCELLRMNGIVWHEDATNADTHYLRAFVRHEILPLARERNPHVVPSLSTTCDILSDEDAYLSQLAAKALRNVELRRTESMVALDSARLAALEVAIARRVVRQAIRSVCPECRLEARHVASVLALVAADAGSATIPMGVDVRVEYGMLFIRTRAAAAEPTSGWLEVPGEFALDERRTLAARLVEVPAGENPERMARELAGASHGTRVLLDAEAAEVGGPGSRVWVDSPQRGDVVCPLGMKGQSKKLSDLLNERKIPPAERPLVPVVRTSPTGHVLWVAPLRSDERAKCHASSKLLLELSIRTS